jgi:hypothetical protein
VIAQFYRKHRHQEFLRFLKLIDQAVPTGLGAELVQRLIGLLLGFRLVPSPVRDLRVRAALLAVIG